jgi:hypothetical protein
MADLHHKQKGDVGQRLPTFAKQAQIITLTGTKVKVIHDTKKRVVGPNGDRILPPGDKTLN